MHLLVDGRVLQKMRDSKVVDLAKERRLVGMHGKKAVSNFGSIDRTLIFWGFNLNLRISSQARLKFRLGVKT